MVDKFTELVFSKLDKICPEETVKITKLEGKITSGALQKLSRQRLREFSKHGNSERFKEIKKKQAARIKLEGQKQLEKQLENSEEKGLKWFKEAKRISARPGDNTSNTFTLPNHVDRNLTSKESAEEIVAYFAKISQEFTPIEEEVVPETLIEKLETGPCEHPDVMEHDIFENMKKQRRPTLSQGIYQRMC